MAYKIEILVFAIKMKEVILAIVEETLQFNGEIEDNRS